VVGAADGAAEEHRARALPEVGQEVLELGCVVPAAHTKVCSKLVECFGAGGEFGVSDLADEGGGVVAVD
jgi:hypothetical protein